MKALNYLGASFLALAIFVAPLQADGSGTKKFDGIKTTVIQCGDDPNGNWRCTRTEYNDGSNCTIIDNEGAPGGLFTSGCGKTNQR